MRSIIAGGLLILFVMNALGQDKTVSADQAAMVATERVFAKLGYERGIRESFIKYFSPDCIVFAPHPVKYRAELENQKPETFPLPVVLNWSPVWGDISAAGDMGYNTGPVTYEDTGENKRPTRHVIFFSVWKKQADGKWLVVLDVGSGVPSAVAPLDTPYTSVSKTAPRKKKLNAGDEKARMLQADRDLMAASASGGIGAWAGSLDDNIRVHRPRTMPVVGKEAVGSWLALQKYSYKGEPMFSDIAASGDLGYTYGSVETGNAEGLKGYYARVWKRDNKGAWKVVVDIFSPLPPVVKPAD
jgi:ketosteroid isomerase-like protein